MRSRAAKKIPRSCGDSMVDLCGNCAGAIEVYACLFVAIASGDPAKRLVCCMLPRIAPDA